MKKKLTVLFLTFMLILALSVTVFAESEDSVESINVFDTVYGILLKNSDKILSALAFISSAALLLIYKRGLLPILKGALTSLGSSVTEIKEETENASKNAADGLVEAANKLAHAEKTIFSLTERLAEIEEKLSGSEELRNDSEKLRLIMNYQIEMLYEVFMSSSLPAYRKEAIGEKISEMKSRLAEKTAVTEVESNEKCS